ncbi:MAG TPA: pilus assembly protein [Herbaspirillum sp.]|jgi:type IV pilus assembly protein PilX
MRNDGLHRQQGAALVIALLMLIVLMMLGIAAMQTSLQSEKMSRNRRDRQIAWEAAEAALLDAEYDIGNPNSQRYALFGGNNGKGEIGEFSTSGISAIVIYGQYSGRLMQTGIGALPALPPRYRIALLPQNPGKPSPRRYRISALGFGPDRHTQVVLQSVYLRQAASAGPAAHPSARLSWREIASGNFP